MDEQEADFGDYLRNRHPSTQEKMQWFEYGHLPAGTPREVSALIAGIAIEFVKKLQDGPQLVIGLQRLIDAKDCMVRQAIADGRNKT